MNISIKPLNPPIKAGKNLYVRYHTYVSFPFIVSYTTAHYGFRTSRAVHWRHHIWLQVTDVTLLTLRSA